MRPRNDLIRGSRRVCTWLPLLSVAIVSCCCAASSVRAGVEITKIRYWTSPGSTRVVLDLSGGVAYDLRRVGHPDRIALNIPGAIFREHGTIVVGDGMVLRIRRNVLSDKAQVVLDLDGDPVFRHFALLAEGGRPDRIVVDIFRPESRDGPAADRAPLVGTDPAAAGAIVAPASPRYTVVIDPGHGGMDPGAIRKGVREKDVVLAIARELAELLDAREGYRAVLTRTGDYFVSLAERVQIAEKARGDLFLSIHANTHANSATSGLETYFLSLERATDSEAQALADQENAADRVGLSPAERQDDVISILMDLRMSRILTQSNRLAEHLIGSARRSGSVEGRKVKQAGFMVLRSLAMPSVLVEAAYLSNGSDRELLRSRAGQRELAGLLCEGVVNHRGDERPDLGGEPRRWVTPYRVRSGDTLWRLALRHATSVREIRDRNGLDSDNLSVGQSLLLP
ncbi:N-acetylmuramoyl-L-alanine amidase [bacterium]|nr:N-acetylmuramoyl-L-alanine amidase [bacterium]